MGGCQNYGPFLDPYYNTAPNIWGTQKRTIILTTTHMAAGFRFGQGQGFGILGLVWGQKSSGDEAPRRATVQTHSALKPTPTAKMNPCGASSWV